MRLSAEIVNAKSFNRETLIAMTGNNSMCQLKEGVGRKSCISYLIRREVWTSKLCSTLHLQRNSLCHFEYIHGGPRYRSHKRKEDIISYLVPLKSRVEFDFDDRDAKTL